MTVRMVFHGFWLFCLLSLFAGCAGVPYEPATVERETPKAETVPPPKPVVDPSPSIAPQTPKAAPRQPAPQTIAALELSRQAQVLLDSKRPDDAIRLLERALNIDPANGQSYYFMAEAWLMKGEKSRAREFNRIANLHLAKDDAWMEKVRLQKEKIGN